MHMKNPKNTICLWFNKDAQDAARFYAATFPDSEVTAVHRAPLQACWRKECSRFSSPTQRKGQDRAWHAIAATPISWSIWMSQRKPRSQVESVD